MFVSLIEENKSETSEKNEPETLFYFLSMYQNIFYSHLSIKSWQFLFNDDNGIIST